MSRESALTTTSYAILGLLSMRSWTTYELTRQMHRTLGPIWPRAQSKLYEEPKKLVRQGLAAAASESIGRRPRTVYSITPQGQRALTEWLKEPGAGPVLESEQLLKVFFAGSGTSADTLATLRAAHVWAAERSREYLASADVYNTDDVPVPEGAAQTILIGRFLTDYYRLVAEWAGWAARIVEKWPNDPRCATPDRTETTETLRRASQTANTAVPHMELPSHERDSP